MQASRYHYIRMVKRISAQLILLREQTKSVYLIGDIGPQYVVSPSTNKEVNILEIPAFQSENVYLSSFAISKKLSFPASYTCT